MNTRFALFIGIIQGLLFVGHALLYLALNQFLEIPEGPATTALQTALAVLSVSFMTASIVTYRTDHPLARWFYNIAAVWLGLLHILLLASLLIAASELSPYRSPVIALSTYSVGILYAAFGWCRTRFPRITHVTVRLPNLPETWRHARIVWISDVHLGHINGHRFARRIVNKINRLEPELVCVGGDLYDGGRVDVEQVTQPFRELQSKHGTVFVTGNHELFTGDTRFADAVNSVGMQVLDDQKIEIEGLQVIGIDWHTSRSRDRLGRTLAQLAIDPSRPSLLLIHSPDRIDIAEQAGISLQVSGHTHHGQMWPFSLITKRVYKDFDYGLKQFKNMQVYTSSGTGTWGPPIRLGTRSEIVCFTLD